MDTRHYTAAAASGAKSQLYLAPLDGLRFFAFLIVLMNHSVPPSSGLMMTIHERGWIGVELFFVISSFLLFKLFQAEYVQTGRIRVASFFIRRLLRLYPLMIAAPLAFMLGMHGRYDVQSAWLQFGSIALFVDNLLFLDTFRRAIPFAEHLWSLSFEGQIYLVLPGLFLLLTRLGSASFLWVLFIIWILCLGLRTYVSSIPEPHPFIYFLPVLRPDSVLLGLALSLIPIRSDGGGGKVALTVLLGGGVLFLSVPNVNVIGPLQVILYPAAALVCGALVWLSLDAKWLANVLGSKFLVYLGKRSFGIYIFHIAAHAFSTSYLLPLVPLSFVTPWSNFLLLIVLTLVLSVGAAVLSYRYFEAPFLRIKDKWAAVLSRPV